MDGTSRQPTPRDEGGDALDERLTEAVNPRTRDIDTAAPVRLVQLIQEEDRRVPEAVAAEADAVAGMIEDVADRLREGGRLFYVGAGTSGRLGVLDAAECPPTFGTDPRLVQGIIAGGREALVRSREGVEDDRGAGRRAIRDAEVGPRDYVLGIATSGTTPYVLAAISEAAEVGAGTGFLSCTSPPEEARRAADRLVTPLVGPEVIAGSTRMKAGTATKLVLNTLTTGVMIRLGKVYGNLMVDLQAVSRKLVDRSLRIVRLAAGVDEPRAREALLASGGSAKTAIAMIELGASRAVAERALDACGGFLRRTLDRFGGMDEVPYYACYGEELEMEARRRVAERLREGPASMRRALEERDARSPAGTAGEGDDSMGNDGPPVRHPWSPARHLAHLVETEEKAFRPRIVGILAAGQGREPTFPDWTPSVDPPLGDRPQEELLERFAAERAATMDRLEEAPLSAWDRRAVVSGERVRLHQCLRGMAHHDRAHATRIAERLHPSLRGDGAP
ncbi:MAG: N-acetylmuramic acid 6-phosphate etherase [Gemmatimonadota bacterium]